ncbi:MAG: hypothetical protein PVSMB5_02820 [Ktedonobacteraceae bacterium]
MSINSRWLRVEGDTRKLLIKWILALLVPVALFTFLWSGEAIQNNVLLGIVDPANSLYTSSQVFLAAIFIVIFYATVVALAGYLVAADSDRRSPIEVWADILFYVVLPMVYIIGTNNLLIGLGLSTITWGIYIFARKRVLDLLHYTPPVPLEKIQTLNEEQKADMMNRAHAGGFWFAFVFAIISLIVDIIFFVTGSLPIVLLIWAIVRTILLPIAGYFLGQLGGSVALRRVISPNETAGVVQNGNGERNGQRGFGWRRNVERVSKKQQLETLSKSRAREEAPDLVPNDLPLQSRGASRFYLTLLGLFVLFYPVIDPILFGSGTKGRITSYGDLGYYVILALGLNIVVGFAGLLDLGYVAFFVIGTYSWALVGSTQFTVLTGIVTNPQFISWLFWPMIIVAALIAALWGVLLGAPTLRLRGDYLAIVTLGFGEIIPAFFLNLDKYTGGINGISGIYRPATPCIQPFFCLNWNGFDPTPYYYLILALIFICIFANVRLRDSRLGRAWVAIREDEIAASSSGINLVNTKLFAFAAGAFFSGIAGIYHAAKLGTIAPTDFNSNDSFIFLAMVVIGGLGSIPGVIVGAVVVYAINLLILAQLDTFASDPTNLLHIFPQYIANFSFSNIRNLLFGIILITIMIFRPEGLIPSARRKRELHRATEEEAVEVGTLDQPPGSTEFEAEVRVE